MPASVRPRAMARACCESTVVAERFVTPLASAPTIPGSSRAPGRPRWKVADLARPSSRQDRLVDERKIAGSTKGRRILALVMAGCRLSRLARRFALRLARMTGLSTVLDRPSVVQVQLCTSPVSTPGRLLISTRNRPAGESTRASTSLTLPSSSMNSKLVQTCQGSRSGSWLRSQSSASRSHAKLDSAMTCQRAAPSVMC